MKTVLDVVQIFKDSLFGCQTNDGIRIHHEIVRQQIDVASVAAVERFFVGLHENVVDVCSLLWVMQQRQLLLTHRIDLRRESHQEELPHALNDAVEETRYHDDPSDD